MNFKQKILIVQNASLLYRTTAVKKEKIYCLQVRLYSDVKEKLKPRPSLKNLLSDTSPLKPSKEAEELLANPSYAEGNAFENERESEETDLRTVILFPGQGNQFVGMASKLLKYPIVRDMFDEASETLGYNLLKVCQEGPQERLNRTEYCQPATFVCSLGALEMLKDEKPWAIDQCTIACGYSLGELSALTFAGCFSFGRAVNLVKLRAKLMSQCCNMVEGGMMSVRYGKEEDLQKAIEEALTYCRMIGIKNPVCSVAVDLFSQCKIIGGHVQALNYLVENKSKYHIRKLQKLTVSGAFHTNLMKDAAEPFHEFLEKVKINDPLIAVYSNALGLRYRNGADVLKWLPKQIYLPVRWEKTVNSIFNPPNSSRPTPFSFECGPGSSLKATLGKISHSADGICYSVKL